MTSSLPMAWFSPAAEDAAGHDGDGRWRRLFESAPVGIALCDASGRFLEVNRALETLLSLDARALSLRSLMQVVQPNFLPEGRPLEEEIAGSRDGVYHVERRYLRPDGDLRWIRMNASLTRTAGREPRRILALFEDVSARIDAQERFAEQAALLDQVPDAILVVDDERDIREVAEAAVASSGYRVITAADGAEAVAQYAAHRGQIDLVLLDMAMPYLDGTTTLRALRKLDPAVRVVIASGIHTRRGGDGPDALTFVLKPFTTDTLLEVVAHELESTAITQA